jgi:hypothetical protein
LIWVKESPENDFLFRGEPWASAGPVLAQGSP